MIFAGILLMIPAAIALMWRIAKIVAPQLTDNKTSSSTPSERENTMTPTIDLLRNHRSIRHFTDAPISDQQREAIIAGAQGASSSSFYNVPRLFALPTRRCVSSWLS